MTTSRTVRNIGVIGGGYVGHGVALQFAQFGYNVIVFNRTKEGSKKAADLLRKSVELSIQIGLFAESKKEEIFSLISFENDFQGVVQRSDFIVESTSEKLDLKRKIFLEMDSIASPDVILASETSGLLLSQIVEGIDNPERCIVTHSYTPPFLIPVVEVVPGDMTSSLTIEKTLEILKSVGKTPVVCKETIGHIGVRLTTALRREAFHIVQEGYASAESVDKVFRSISTLFPILGILMLSDFSGADVLSDVHKNIQPHLNHRKENAKILEDLLEEGALGVKSGLGFYKWDKEDINEIMLARNRELARWIQDANFPKIPEVNERTLSR